MAHQAIGRLRGRPEPREDILDRVLQIHPDFRVYYSPQMVGPGYDRWGKLKVKPACWVIYQFQQTAASNLRQQAGRYMLARIRRTIEAAEKAGDTSKLERINTGLTEKAEEMIDLVHWVADYPEEMFGTERMFQELYEAVRDYKKNQQEIELALARAEREEIDGEVDQNEVFDQHLKDVCMDEYSRVCLGAVSRPAMGFGSAAPAPPAFHAPNITVPKGTPAGV